MQMGKPHPSLRAPASKPGHDIHPNAGERLRGEDLVPRGVPVGASATPWGGRGLSTIVNITVHLVTIWMNQEQEDAWLQIATYCLLGEMDQQFKGSREANCATCISKLSVIFPFCVFFCETCLLFGVCYLCVIF